MCQLYRFMFYGMVVITPRIANSTENSKSDVIHCFSDPLSDELYQYYQKCPLESFKHGGRCRNAYIDHYKEMVMYEIGISKDLHLATALPEQHMSKIQDVHKIPRKETVCVDFDEQCYCKWINIHDGMCHRLKARSVLLAGDSMLRKQLEQLKSICPKQQALYRPLNTIFNPAHRRDFDYVKKELMDNKSVSIFYVGFALHSISESNHNDREYADLWTHYESYISKTIETVNKLRPDVQVVWFIPNTIISTHLYGDFRERFDAVLMNNLAKMHQNNREKWELSVSRPTRRSVVALAQRSERILQQRFPEVHVISGLRITDFMERYTDAKDGVHFPPIPSPKAFDSVHTQ